MQPLPDFEWKFDAVPEDELIACCYWEYARESAFLRKLRQRCLESWRAGGERDAALSAALSKLPDIPGPVDIITRGIYFAPDNPRRIDRPDAPPVPNSFPAPWQALPAVERAFRVRVTLNIGWVPAVPFERTDWLVAKGIAEQAEAAWQEIMVEYRRVQQENPDASEVQLIAQGKLQPFLGIPVSLFQEGSEATVVAINWAQFTNEELVKAFARWVKANRPEDVKAPDRRGHKAGDWRANLTRLAALRLLAHFTVRELVAENAFPAVWKAKQFGGKKWDDPTKWRDARREAAALFHRLFPFLPKEDRPLSWERDPAAGGR